MSSSSIPRIKEDIKRDILKLLVRSIQENAPLENVSYSGILNEMKENSEKIDKAISELEEEDVITSHDITMKIYLPASDEGKAVLKRLTEEESISYSPYWLMVFSLLIYWIAVPYLKLQLPSDFAGTTLIDSYLVGIKDAIVYSAFIGVIGAYILKNIFIKLKKMQILSPTLYRNMNNFVKYTIALSVLGGIVYGVLESNYGFQFTNAALTYFLGSLGISLAYVFSQGKRSEDK